MLIVALILAVIGLAALVTAVVTSNELIAWVCIGASGVGVLLLLIDAIRDRARRPVGESPAASASAATEVIEPVEITEVIEPVEITEVIEPVATAGDDSAGDDSAGDDSAGDDSAGDENAATADEFEADDDHPEELVHDDPDFDTYSDDEPEFPEPAEEAAVHVVGEDYLLGDAEAETEGRDDGTVAGESTLEVHYTPSAEDSSTTVVYSSSESIEDTDVGDEYRDQ